MNTRNRLILFVAGLGLAWTLMLAGDEMHAWAQAAAAAGNIAPLVFLVGFGTVTAIIGVILLLMVVALLCESSLPGDMAAALVTSVVAICFSFVFGAVGGASGTDAWKSVWDFLLILGLLPISISVADLLADILRAHRKTN